MAGISISLLGVNDDWLRWLDAETTAPAWPNLLKSPPATRNPSQPSRAREQAVTRPLSNGFSSNSAPKTRRAIEAACHALIAAEPELTELDRITGDGDLGTGMERAAKAVLAAIGSYPLDDIPATIKALGHTLRRELGGSSGPLYGVLFLRCAECSRYRWHSRHRTVGPSLATRLPSYQRLRWRTPRRPHHARCARSLRKSTQSRESLSPLQLPPTAA